MFMFPHLFKNRTTNRKRESTRKGKEGVGADFMPYNQCCGTVTIYYGSGSTSQKVTVPTVPVPVPVPVLVPQ